MSSPAKEPAPKFEEINNFDRLYNKRIDWRSILIKERIEEKKKLENINSRMGSANNNFNASMNNYDSTPSHNYNSNDTR